MESSYRILESKPLEWVLSTIFELFWLACTSVGLAAFLTSVHPFWNRVISIVVYFAFAGVWLAAIIFILTTGFCYRWTNVNDEDLVIHDVHLGLLWRRH